ncbi:MAG TPA: metalloprotease [Erysipelothrix sp.]|nr:metalloprotease [Erysipelothrix sp.]
MKWRDGRRSSNVEDRRGQRQTRSTGGSFSPMTMGGGIGGLIIMLILYFVMGGMGGTNSPFTANQDPVVTNAQEDELKEFTSVVLAYTEDIWHELFREQGLVYEEPRLVVFTDQVESGCGFQSAQVGPFYCPADKSVYIDLSFFSVMESQLGAEGDFAMAYVIAHEVGHHVQNLLGITDEMNRIRQSVSQTEYNRYSVALELQADYLAGVWAHHVEDFGVLEEGDLEEALNAASAIGDDTLQKRSSGRVVPDNFTHGTSEQRRYWLYRGFDYGDLNHGDTFAEIIQ